METVNLPTFLVNSLWQAPLVTAVAALAAWLMRHGPARYRNAVWMAALVAAVLAPLASLRTVAPKPTPVHPRAAVAVQPPMAPAPAPAASPVSGRKALAAEPIMVPFAARTAQLLIAAYCLFLPMRLARLSLAWWRTVRIRHAARQCGVPQPVECAWARCRRTLGVERVELLASPTVPGPLMAGAWRRTVIVPDSLLAETSEDILITALGHEMAHAKRHDFFFNVLCELLYIPISFNPVAWIVRRGIERTREMACDELVTARLLDRRAYARSIVSLAAGMASPRHPGYTLGVFDGDILEERIRRLVEGRVANLRQARLLLVAGLSALAVCAVVASGLALSARAQGGVRPELTAGVEAINRGDVDAAIRHFTAAVQLEPANLLAKLHLANADIAAYGQSHDSGLLQRARRQYEDAISLDPANRSAILGLVSLSGPDQSARSRELLQRLLDTDRGNAMVYFYKAMQDWEYAYPRIQQALRAAGIPPTQAVPFLPDAAARKALREEVKPQLEEGLRMAQTAMELDPGLTDPMAYLNLLYRSMATIADDPEQARVLIARADGVIAQAIAAQRLAAAAAPAQTIDADSPPPLAHSIVLAPPPPPPPPPAAGYLEVATRDPNAPLASARFVIDRLNSLGFRVGEMRRGDDKLYHIYVGPYQDDAQLREAKAKLESLGFQPKPR
ncbi:MAG TPA: M56 family metallopeptidase [Bryobacteraceae bacterium]|nr:M56 family metallopeptidase [Bryobacteraceae bacterium]